VKLRTLFHIPSGWSFFLMAASLITSACDDNDADQTTEVSTISFSPASGVVGNTVTITGMNFRTTPMDNEVKFDGIATEVTSATSTQLKAIVPFIARTGKITVKVNGTTTTSDDDFTITPIVMYFLPTSAAPGATIVISINGFTELPNTTYSVKVNGEEATITEVSHNDVDTKIKFTVPASATSGRLCVVINGASACPGDFTVL
jgi:hypothetical protein